MSKKLWFWIAIAAVMLFMGCRVAEVFNQEVFIDFLAYGDVSRALLLGLNPYDLKNLVFHPWGDLPIVFPGYMALFAWIMLFDIHVAAKLFLILNIIFGIFLIFLAFRHMGFLRKAGWKQPGKGELMFVVSVALLLTSSPFLSTLRHGQCTIIIALGFLWLMIPSGTWSKMMFFSIIAVLKYSLLPLVGLALFVKRHYWLCIAAFLLFMCFAIAPLLTGHDLSKLYREYFAVVKAQTSEGGFNTFAVSGYNMITLDFLRWHPLAVFIKGVLSAVAIFVILRERKDSGFGLNLLLLLSCLTMLIVYNRIYNLIIIQLLLVLKVNLSFRAERYYETIVPGFFLLFFVCPLGLVFKLSDLLGQLIGPVNLVYYSCFGNMKNIFPVLPLIMIGVVGYALWEYLTRHNDYIFPVTDKRSGP